MPVQTGGSHRNPELIAAIQEVLESDAFTERLVTVIDRVVTRTAAHRDCGTSTTATPTAPTKRCRCARCCPQRFPGRSMVTMMLLPIPFINPFWWADSCHQRSCGPAMPECCHEGSDKTPPGHPPGTIG